MPEDRLLWISGVKGHTTESYNSDPWVSLDGVRENYTYVANIFPVTAKP